MLIGILPFAEDPMSDGQKTVETLENLCRQASQELDSKKLNQLIEQIDTLLDEQHKARSPRKSV